MAIRWQSGGNQRLCLISQIISPVSAFRSSSEIHEGEWQCPPIWASSIPPFALSRSTPCERSRKPSPVKLLDISCTARSPAKFGSRTHSAVLRGSPAQVGSDPTQLGSHSARIPLSPDPSLTERCGIEPHGAVRLTILGRPPEGRVDQVCAFLIWIKPHLPNTFLIWIRSVAPLSE